MRRGWRFASALACIAGLAISLSACLTVPTAQTDAMVAATNDVASASDTLFADLNTEEKQLTIRKTNADPNVFVPADAVLYSTLGTYAPETAHFYAAISVLKNYAILVQSLAEGKSATAEANSIKTTVDNLSAVGKAALPGFSAEIASLDAAAGAFAPLVEKALAVRTAGQARELVQEGATPVKDTIDALRAATPAMFGLLYAKNKPAITQVDFPERDKARIRLSDFVVLLDRLQDAFDKLNQAFQNPSDPATATALAQASGELAADVKIVQQTLSALR